MDGRRRTCRGAGRLYLMALHFLSFTAAHSEGGLGIGIGALVRSCLMRLFLDGFHGWLCIVHISTGLIQGCMGGFCERGSLAGNACVIHIVPSTFLFSQTWAERCSKLHIVSLLQSPPVVSQAVFPICVPKIASQKLIAPFALQKAQHRFTLSAAPY